MLKPCSSLVHNFGCGLLLVADGDRVIEHCLIVIFVLS